MTKRDDGGPAFPSEGEGHGNPMYHSPGMTLRDYFAGQALAGLARDISDDVTIHRRDRIVSSAYEIADAMLKERNK